MSVAEQEVAEQVEELDLRGEIEAAMETDESPEADEPKSERERDEKGRFVASTTEKVTAVVTAGAEGEETPVETPESEAPKEEAPEPDEPISPTLKAPNGWTAEAKAKWAELPMEVQQAVDQREQDAHKKISQNDEERNFGRAMYRTVQPYMAQIQAEGGTPESAVSDLLNTAYVLRTGSPEQKRILILQTAQQFGIDLSNTEIPQITPEFTALSNRLNQLEGHITSREQKETERLQTEVNEEIEAFASDPANVHYGEVKAHMAALLSQGAATDLKDAYEQACWARPDIRATLLAEEKAKEEQKRRDEAKAKAEEARRKDVSITGGRGATSKSASVSRSLREEIEANVAASSGVV